MTTNEIINVQKAFLLLLVICTLYGFGSGLYHELTVDSTDNDSNSINWKRGVIRLTLVLSSGLGIIVGLTIPKRAKTGEFLHEEDGEAFYMFTNPKSVFVFFFHILIWIGMVYIFYYPISWLLHLYLYSKRFYRMIIARNPSGNGVVFQWKP